MARSYRAIATSPASSCRIASTRQRFAGAEVVAGYRAADPHKGWGFPLASTFEDLLATEPDIVAICSPPWAHAEQTIASLERGSHVLVEKPRAMNAGEAQEMADAAERNGKLLCVAHSHRFDRSVMKALFLVESGALGELVSV